MNISNECRWCNESFPPHPIEIQIGDAISSRSVCPACNCWQGHVTRVNVCESTIGLYVNPDLSMFIEFVGNGTFARYVLSPDRLRELGLLTEFDHDPHGRKEAREGMGESRVGTMPGSGIPLPHPPFGMSDGEAREAARVRAESFCACGRRLPECDGSRAGFLGSTGGPGVRDTKAPCDKAFRDWDAIGALLSGDEPHAEDAQNDLRELDAALSRAESAELGCEIAYRREPTQAEGDAHEYRHEQSMGASEAIRECHVPMGNHHGHRCLCGRWVWGGPTVCQRCVDAEAVKITLEWKAEADRLRLRADTDAKVKAATNENPNNRGDQ